MKLVFTEQEVLAIVKKHAQKTIDSYQKPEFIATCVYYSGENIEVEFAENKELKSESN